MILKFEVKYCTVTGQYQVDSEDAEITHSGSSYLRINTPEIYGTIGCHDPTLKGDSAYNYLNFSILKQHKEQEG